jgi:hypothetical protein
LGHHNFENLSFSTPKKVKDKKVIYFGLNILSHVAAGFMQKTYVVLETKLPYDLDQKILKLMIAISYGPK